MEKQSLTLVFLTFLLLNTFGMTMGQPVGTQCKTNQDCVKFCLPLPHPTPTCVIGFCSCVPVPPAPPLHRKMK